MVKLCDQGAFGVSKIQILGQMFVVDDLRLFSGVQCQRVFNQRVKIQSDDQIVSVLLRKEKSQRMVAQAGERVLHGIFQKFIAILLSVEVSQAEKIVVITAIHVLLFACFNGIPILFNIFKGVCE